MNNCVQVQREVYKSLCRSLINTSFQLKSLTCLNKVFQSNSLSVELQGVPKNPQTIEINLLLEFQCHMINPKGRKSSCALQRYFNFLISQYLKYVPCQYFALFTFSLVLACQAIENLTIDHFQQFGVFLVHPVLIINALKCPTILL